MNRINVRNHATSVFRGRTDLAHSAVDQPTGCIDFDGDHWRGSDGSNCSSYFEGEVNHGRCAEVKNDSGVSASEACCVACSQHDVSRQWINFGTLDVWVTAREYPQKMVDWNRRYMPPNVTFHYFNDEDVENSVFNISTFLEQEQLVQERICRFDFRFFRIHLIVFCEKMFLIVRYLVHMMLFETCGQWHSGLICGEL